MLAGILNPKYKLLGEFIRNIGLYRFNVASTSHESKPNFKDFP
jgi:hypothetical protein